MARPLTISDGDVLEIARACFIELGPAVSTNLIAERVGLSQAALFKRFGTKKKLMMAALMPPATPPFIGMLEAGPTAEPLDVQLLDVGRAVFAFFRDIVPCVATLAASGFDRDDLFAAYDIPPPIRTQMAMTAWFARAIEQGLVRPGNPVDLATAFLGTLHVRAFMKHIGAPLPEDPTDYLRNVVRIFTQGIQETP